MKIDKKEAQERFFELFDMLKNKVIEAVVITRKGEPVAEMRRSPRYREK